MLTAAELLGAARQEDPSARLPIDLERARFQAMLSAVIQ